MRFLDPQPEPPGSSPVDVLYESQISIAVTGIYEHIWTAYGLIDTYHDNSDIKSRYHESVSKYHKLSRDGERPDPIAFGRIASAPAMLSPRLYYLRVWEIRLRQVKREWQNIWNWIGAKVQECEMP